MAAAEKELEEVQALQARLKAKYDGQMAEKNALQEKANKTKKKMEQANRLINSLGDNKDRCVPSTPSSKHILLSFLRWLSQPISVRLLWMLYIFSFREILFQF